MNILSLGPTDSESTLDVTLLWAIAKQGGFYFFSQSYSPCVFPYIQHPPLQLVANPRDTFVP